MNEAKVPGTKEMAFLRGIRKLGLKRLGSHLRLVPIPFTDALALNPDFADTVLPDPCFGFWVHDIEFLAGQYLATSHKFPDFFLPSFRRQYPVLIEGRSVKPTCDSRLFCIPSRDDQRCFGHAVAGVVSVRIEAKRSKLPGKRRESIRANRFRSVKRDLPTGKIKPFAVGRFDSFDTQLKREIGTSADGRTVFVNGPQPSDRLSKEGHGAHERTRASYEDWIEDAPDKAHVVIRRKPTDCPTISSALERVGNDLAVVHDVRMSQHDAFWRAR